MLKVEFPYTYRSAFLLYRLLQLRYANREQIKRHIFRNLSSDSQRVQITKHLKPMLDNGYLKEIFGLIYVSPKGWQILSTILDNPPKRPNGWTDAFYQIDRDFIETPPNPGHTNQPQMEHHRLIAETLIHFLEEKELRTASNTELQIKGLANIKPDHTLLKNKSMGFIEVENKGEVKDIQEKMRRYIRYYFSGDFQKQFSDKKYCRVFVVHNQENKLEDLMDFLLNLTYKKVGFKKPVHAKTDHIGRNLFRFSGLDFGWIKAGDWSKHKHNGEPLKKRGAWE